MALPWNTLDTVPTADGPLVLRQRGERDFLITIAGRVLMTSTARRSEEALATLALGALPAAATPRVLIGGLGMGYTLRAALEVLPAGAKVDVAELTPAVVRWCRGPLAPLTDAAVADRRVRVHVGDVAAFIGRSQAAVYDAIVMDLYEGPYARKGPDPLFGDAAIARAVAALRVGGTLAVWSEDPDAAFPRTLRRAGLEVRFERAGRGGRQHVIYLGVRTLAVAPARPAIAPRRRR